MSESRGLCFVDGEHHRTVALCYVNYCIGQSLVDKSVRLWRRNLDMVPSGECQSLEGCSLNFHKGVEHSAQARSSTRITASTPTSQLLHDLDRYESVFRGLCVPVPLPPSRPSCLIRIPEAPTWTVSWASARVSPNPMPALRTSLSDSSCSGETYSNMVVDFNVSVEARNSTSLASRSNLTLARPTPIY